MSKKRRKSEFGHSPKTTERYYEVLSQSDSGPTIEKTDEENEQVSKATDAILPDDISLPERFSEQVKFLDKHKEIGFVGSSCEIIDEKGEFLNFVYLNGAPEKNVSCLRKNNIFCHGSMMFRKNALIGVSGYREFFRYAQDYDLYLRLIQNTLPGALHGVLYRKRVALENISIQSVRLQAAYANLAKRCYKERMLKKDDGFLLEKTFLDVDSLKIYDFILPFMKSLSYLKCNDNKRARAQIQPYLFPLMAIKYRLYLLWLASYLPFFARNTIFMINKSLRKIRLSVKSMELIQQE